MFLLQFTLIMAIYGVIALPWGIILLFISSIKQKSILLSIILIITSIICLFFVKTILDDFRTFYN